MARSRSLIAPVAAIIVSGVVGAFFFSMVNSNNTKAVVQAPPIIKEAPTVQILVANNNINVGKKLTTADLSWRAWPESLINQEYITIIENPDKIDKLIGGIAKIQMVSGEPIIEGKIVQPGDRGAMAVLLRKGMRAVSVPIAADTSAGGFIMPGDYVDVILTATIVRESLFKPKVETRSAGANNTTVEPPVLQSYLELKAISKSMAFDPNLIDIQVKPASRSDEEKTKIKMTDEEISQEKLDTKLKNESELLVASNTHITEVLLDNVRVLAIDQSVNQDISTPQGETQPGGSPQASGQTASKIGTTATLEVTPEQAKLLAWSVSTGKLTLSLRSFSEVLPDNQSAETASSLIPVTKTSFAWPLDRIIKINKQSNQQAKDLSEKKETDNQEDLITKQDSQIDNFVSNEDTVPQELQLIRSGRISVLSSVKASKEEAKVKDSNAIDQKSQGDVDVKR